MEKKNLIRRILKRILIFIAGIFFACFIITFDDFNKSMIALIWSAIALICVMALEED